MVLALSKITLNFETSFRVYFLTIAVFFTILKCALIDVLFSHQFASTMIKSIVKYSLVVLPLLLNKKITILGPPIEYASILHVLDEIYLNPMPVLEPIQKFSIIYFASKIAYHSLVNSFNLLLTEVDTILKFLNNGIIEINDQLFHHVLKISIYFSLG